ncbi:MAG: winged helix-turn-helix domain-containing protein, partial [Hyphomicrobiaceae bacterium]
MTEKCKPTAVDLDGQFRLGDCHIEPNTGLVSNGEQTTRLQPQAVDVLRYLARRAGEVVSRHDLEDAVWSDRTVGYDALTGTMFKLRKALGDDPKSPRLIETISKRGYRLLVAPQPIDDPDHQLRSESAPVRQRVLPSLLRAPASIIGLAAAALIIVVMTITSWQLLGNRKPESTISSQTNATIVVLPFETIGSPGSETYLADGLTEDLTTALAKLPNLTVIARDSASLYKVERTSLDRLAQALKVKFALRGSVRHHDERIRINAQLINVRKGTHVWVEQIDDRAGNVFDVQSLIIGKLTQAIFGRPANAKMQAELVARTKSSKAYRFFQLGRQHFYLYINKQENAKAREYFATALEHDPDFAMAHAMLAWTHAFDAMNGWATDRDASLQMANHQANKAKELDPRLPLSYFIAGLVHRERGDYVKAMVDAE